MTQELPRNTSPLAELAPFAAISLIAVDIDGTLATAQGQEVAHLVKEAVKSLGHYGVYVTVATGRAVAGAQDTIFGLNRRLGPAIVYNGAVVVDLGQEHVLARSRIEESDVAVVRDLCLQHEATMWAYDCWEPGFDTAESWESEGIREVVRGWSNTPGPNTELNGLPVDWSDPGTPPGSAVAILVARSDTGLGGLLRELRALPTISVTSSTAEYLEIRPLGTSTASALQKVAAQRGLEARRVLTIGDNHNDVEMLEWAGISVAVANATDAARSSATYWVAQSDARGVIETLRLVISAKRFARGLVLENGLV